MYIITWINVKNINCSCLMFVFCTFKNKKKKP